MNRLTFIIKPLLSLFTGHRQGQRGSQPLLLARIHCPWLHSWVFLRH